MKILGSKHLVLNDFLCCDLLQYLPAHQLQYAAMNLYSIIDCTVQCAVVTRNHESTVMSIFPVNVTNFTPGIDVSIACIYSGQQCISEDAYL